MFFKCKQAKKQQQKKTISAFLSMKTDQEWYENQPNSFLAWATASGLTKTLENIQIREVAANLSASYLIRLHHSDFVAFLHLNQKSLALKTELDGKVASLTRSRSRSWKCGMPQDDEGVELMPSCSLQQEKWTGSSSIKGPSQVYIDRM